MKDKAEEVLEKIFNLSLDMICVCTPEGKIIKVNPACTRVLGYTADEILKLGWAKLVHPDDVEKTNTQVEKQLKGGFVMNFINRFRCKDGTYKILEWQATPTIDSTIYATARDITERRKTEESLSDSEAKFRSLAENSQDYIMLYDEQCRHIYENPAALKNAGFKEEDGICK